MCTYSKDETLTHLLISQPQAICKQGRIEIKDHRKNELCQEHEAHEDNVNAEEDPIVVLGSEEPCVS